MSPPLLYCSFPLHPFRSFFPPLFVFLIQYFVLFCAPPSPTASFIFLLSRLLHFFCVLFFIIPSYLTFSSPPLHYSFTILLPLYFFHISSFISTLPALLFSLHFFSIFSQMHPFFLSSRLTLRSHFPFIFLLQLFDQHSVYGNPFIFYIFFFFKFIHFSNVCLFSSFSSPFLLFRSYSLLSSFLLPHLV